MGSAHDRLAPSALVAMAALVVRPAAGAFSQFCGMAVNNEYGNGYSAAHLQVAANTAGAQSVWHYNWRMETDVAVPGVTFVPMIKEPGNTLGRSVDTLPPANTNGAGHIVKGWNEPDDRGQAGHIDGLFTNPGAYAQAWTNDMRVARQKGYTEFVSPAIAHDTCWLDHFLKACETTPGCKDFITYLGIHRYRNDCAGYSPTPETLGWRDDLGYILSFYKIKEKYNQRGFQIKGLVIDELGCLTSDFSGAASAGDNLRYMTEWYQNTLVKVINGDAQVVSKITGTDWIGPNGPDAHSSTYSPGTCGWRHGGDTAGAEAVLAIQSISTIAWFSIHPNKNYLFHGSELTQLGRLYFDNCRTVRSSGTTPPTQGPEPTTAAPTSDPDPQTSPTATATSSTGPRPDTTPVSSSCHTAVEGEACFGHAMWAKENGIRENPDWYGGLQSSSSVESFQQHLFDNGLGDCPQPCDSALGGGHSAGTGGLLWGLLALVGSYTA